MQPQKFRWSKVYESSEEELQTLLATRAITSQPTHMDAFETKEISTTDELTIWCAEGSCYVTIAERNISLQPGDALRVADKQKIIITAGISGCIYYAS